MSRRKSRTQSGPTLWGDIGPSLRATQRPKDTQCRIAPAHYTDCLLYGHTWQCAGMDGRLQCQVCHVFAYCPQCTPAFPPEARLVFCGKHRQEEVHA